MPAKNVSRLAKSEFTEAEIMSHRDKSYCLFDNDNEVNVWAWYCPGCYAWAENTPPGHFKSLPTEAQGDGTRRRGYICKCGRKFQVIIHPPLPLLPYSDWPKPPATGK